MSSMGHHAFFAYGSPQEVDAFVAWVRAERNIPQHSPDFHVRSYESFSVEEARMLTQLATLTSTGNSATFVLSANRLTREAQNALLKTLEEPPHGVHFYILAPRGALLETIRSRCVHVPWKGEGVETEAALFLSGTIADRSAVVERLIESEERGQAEALIDALERLLLPRIEEKEVREALSDIGMVRTYLLDRSPSLKMLLEHLAYTLPRVS